LETLRARPRGAARQRMFAIALYFLCPDFFRRFLPKQILMAPPQLGVLAHRRYLSALAFSPVAGHAPSICLSDRFLSCRGAVADAFEQFVVQNPCTQSRHNVTFLKSRIPAVQEATSSKSDRPDRMEEACSGFVHAATLMVSLFRRALLLQRAGADDSCARRRRPRFFCNLVRTAMLVGGRAQGNQGDRSVA